MPHLDQTHQEASEVDLLGVSQQAIDIFAFACLSPVERAFLLPHVIKGREYLIQFVFAYYGWEYLEIVHHLGELSESQQRVVITVLPIYFLCLLLARLDYLF